MNKTISSKRVNTPTSVANVGANEDQLDAAIFYCLNVLTKRHSPSEHFRSVFSKVGFAVKYWNFCAITFGMELLAGHVPEAEHQSIYPRLALLVQRIRRKGVS